jgi:hypothetical protein
MTDVRRIVPPGIKFEFLAIAFHKYTLVTVDLSPQERLETLEGLNAYVTGDLKLFSKSVVEAIRPCTAATAKMISTALDLPPKPWRARSEGYEILTRGEVFDRLVELNPSLSRAIDLWCGAGRKEAA